MLGAHLSENVIGQRDVVGGQVEPQITAPNPLGIGE